MILTELELDQLREMLSKTTLTLYFRALAIAEDPDNSPTEANDFIRDVETRITSLGEMHKTFMTLVYSDEGKKGPRR